MVGFIIEIKQGDRKWMIEKRRNEVYELHAELDTEMQKDGESLDLEFPNYRDKKDESQESVEKSLEDCVKYLNKLVKVKDAQDRKPFLEFCELSNLSFNLKGCVKYKEGLLKKRSGGRFKFEKKTFFCYCGK